MSRGHGAPRQISADRLRFAYRALLRGDYAETATEAATTGRKIDRHPARWVDGIVLRGGRDAVILQGASDVDTRPANHRIRPLRANRIRDRSRLLEDRRGVDRAEVVTELAACALRRRRVPQLAFIAERTMMRRDPHQGDVREVPVELQEEYSHSSLLGSVTFDTLHGHSSVNASRIAYRGTICTPSMHPAQIVVTRPLFRSISITIAASQQSVRAPMRRAKRSWELTPISPPSAPFRRSPSLVRPLGAGQTPLPRQPETTPALRGSRLR